MNFKMKNIALALIAVASVTGAMNAVAGTVNFTGTITDNTCNFNNGASDLSVPMGAVSSKDFSASGTTSGNKPFTLIFTGCAGTANNLAVRFSGESTTEGYLKIGTGAEAAQNVALGIYDDKNNLVRIGSDTADYAITSGNVSIPLVAKYVATAATVSPGTANASAVFTALYK